MTISRAMLEQLDHHLIRPLKNRIANALARAVVTLVNDGTKMQELQLGVLKDESIDDCERVQNYGVSSVPHVGAEAVVVFPGGDRGLPLVVAVDDRRYRPIGMQPGEVALYTDEGVMIKLARGPMLLLGSAAATSPVTLATEIATLKAAIASWAPTSGDGGASLKAVFSLWLAPGATKVKAE